MAEPDCILQVRGLRKSFGPKVVLDGVDLVIPRGRVTTIVGKSGAGKSVFLKCVAGLVEPDAGEIEVCGSSRSSVLIDPDTGERRVSYMFQHNALFDSMTAVENVALPLIESSRLPRPEIFRRAHVLLEKLEVGDAAGRYPAELSGGMQKRVALARSLLTNPQVVLFDEPTSGLDPMRKNAVLEMIAHYRRAFGFTALMVSHDLPEALYISDLVAVLEEGRVSFCASPQELEVADFRGGSFITRGEDLLRRDLLAAGSMTDLTADFSALRSEATHVVALVLRRQNTTLGAPDRFASFGVVRALNDTFRRQSWLVRRVYVPDARTLLVPVNLHVHHTGEVLAEIYRVAEQGRCIAAPGERAEAPFRVEAAAAPLADLPNPDALRRLFSRATSLFEARPLAAVPSP